MPPRNDGKSRRDEVAPQAIDGWIGSRIRWLRNQKGLRAHEIAAAIGMTRQAVEKYEKGLQRIPAGKLYDIGVALDVHPGWFYEDCPHISLPSNRPDMQAPPMSPHGLDVLTRYERLNPEQRRAVSLVTTAFDEENQARRGEAAGK